MQWLELAGMAIVSTALFIVLPGWFALRRQRFSKNIAVRMREHANEVQEELRRSRGGPPPGP